MIDSKGSSILLKVPFLIAFSGNTGTGKTTLALKKSNFFPI